MDRLLKVDHVWEVEELGIEGILYHCYAANEFNKETHEARKQGRLVAGIHKPITNIPKRVPAGEMKGATVQKVLGPHLFGGAI